MDAPSQHTSQDGNNLPQTVNTGHNDFQNFGNLADSNTGAINVHGGGNLANSMNPQTTSNSANNYIIIGGEGLGANLADDLNPYPASGFASNDQNPANFIDNNIGDQPGQNHDYGTQATQPDLENSVVASEVGLQPRLGQRDKQLGKHGNYTLDESPQANKSWTSKVRDALCCLFRCKRKKTEAPNSVQAAPTHVRKIIKSTRSGPAVDLSKNIHFNF